MEIIKSRAMMGIVIFKYREHTVLVLQAKRISPRRSVFLHNHGWFKYSARETG